MESLNPIELKGLARVTEEMRIRHLWQQGYPIVVVMRDYHRGNFIPQLVRIDHCEVVLRHWSTDFAVPLSSPLLEFYCDEGVVRSSKVGAHLPKQSWKPIEGWIRTRFASIWAGGLKGIELLAVETENEKGQPCWQWSVRNGYTQYGSSHNGWNVVKDREQAEHDAMECYKLIGRS
jgi:hypothetical protein